MLVNSIFIYQKGLDLCLEKELIQIRDVSILIIDVSFVVLVIRLYITFRSDNFFVIFALIIQVLNICSKKINK